MRLLINWLIMIVAVFVAVLVGRALGFDIGSKNGTTDWGSIAIFALVLGLVNAIIGPILKVISLPLTIMSFGLFSLVVNAILFLLAAWLVPSFQAGGFFGALLGSIIVSIVSSVLGGMTNQRV
jgi:putative membrane protein